MSADALDAQEASTVVADGQAPRQVRQRRTAVIAVVAVLLATAAAIGVGVWNAGQSEIHAEALDQWRQARATVAVDVEAAAAVVAGAAADGVKELKAVVALSAVLEDVRSADLEIDPALSRSADVVRAREIVGDVERQRATLGAAVLAARVEHSTWGIEQALGVHEQVAGQLATAIAESDALLEASAGGVLDEASRDVLAAAIEGANAALTAAGADGLREEFTAAVADLASADDATLEAVAAGTLDLGERVVVAADLLASVEDMRTQRELLAQAEQAVVEAQSAWEAERERIAAEQAAAAAAAAAQPRSTSTSGGNSSRTGGSSSTTRGSGGANAPAAKPGSSSSGSSGSGATSSGGGGPSSGGGTWVESGPGGNYCWNGVDTSGADVAGGWC